MQATGKMRGKIPESTIPPESGDSRVLLSTMKQLHISGSLFSNQFFKSVSKE